jgi:hypothetical protein
MTNMLVELLSRNIIATILINESCCGVHRWEYPYCVATSCNCNHLNPMYKITFWKVILYIVCTTTFRHKFWGEKSTSIMWRNMIGCPFYHGTVVIQPIGICLVRMCDRKFALSASWYSVAHRMFCTVMFFYQRPWDLLHTSLAKFDSYKMLLAF